MASLTLNLSSLEAGALASVLEIDLRGMRNSLERSQKFYSEFFQFQRRALDARVRLGIEGYNKIRFEEDLAVIQCQEDEWHREKSRISEGIEFLSSVNAKLEAARGGIAA